MYILFSRAASSIVLPSSVFISLPSILSVIIPVPFSANCDHAYSITAKAPRCLRDRLIGPEPFLELFERPFPDLGSHSPKQHPRVVAQEADVLVLVVNLE